MRRLVYLQAARRDLMGILDHIAREARDVEAGLRFTAILRQQCARLAALPGTLGTARPELRPDLRSFPCRGYVIFFRYRDNAVEVVNVLHGHRDVIGYFGQDPG
ncbi:type II toxin-antitoxin system RelE/ParE family toxin [Pseudoroseomonas wenyumeiae]|uniref:Type II toxin-antitoxin system RelE/ParE family toxin n=1 Tax=Teichococcus wenyumeiae TaxID=2478470 RepID=A0A3A9JLJ4_9PROT|nr:type II toxin-antitoxin system RelE/ParE family toxin [Pseudoroseomonas wenyumeiae]RKK06041.1 type II toxin-antitoxin system RelE/ParE family toxin [Pseudoroseomonas wenyumeiae]RMI19558.1 type II toxin-antitoxin system RelE/ParE family toxin [Pseudoroseomonas wenyumeiae]